MRILPACLLPIAAILLAGCGYSLDHRAVAGGGTGAGTRPAYYIAPPPPGTRRCVVWGEDMYGRRFCDRYYGS